MQLTALCSLILEGIVTVNNLHPQRQMAPLLPEILRVGKVEQENENGRMQLKVIFCPR